MAHEHINYHQMEEPEMYSKLYSMQKIIPILIIAVYFFYTKYLRENNFKFYFHDKIVLKVY